MTTVTFTKTNNEIRVSAHDHAYGNSAVCNAVSGMMFSLEAWILNNPDCVKKHSSDFKAGDARVSFVAVAPEVYTVLGFMIVGLAQVEHNYGRKFLTLNVSDEVKSLVGVRFNQTV